MKLAEALLVCLPTGCWGRSTWSWCNLVWHVPWSDGIWWLYDGIKVTWLVLWLGLCSRCCLQILWNMLWHVQLLCYILLLYFL